ncbi:hypothetical protein UFOVP665_22 [uncultured Caudovirales phage]|jgi:hypothetical protein|uniref:Uncharacterized protein n=1 Tax=uncultured Caudovirales phage TaxID=2100421 RepID=A0A6J5N9D0_9CAUD|nr:hypothetical protein UFOVP665_22 [uncultured Caudovirales phage]
MNTTSTDLDALLGTADPVLSEVSWLAWNAWALALKTDASNELLSALLKASHAAVEAASASCKF